MDIKFIPVTDYAKLFPPEPMKKVLPPWYKDLSLSILGKKFNAVDLNLDGSRTVRTVKKCPPIADFLTSGYCLKIPTEIYISLKFDKTDKSCGFQYRVPVNQAEEVISFHPHSQMPIMIDGYARPYVKFYSGWRVQTPPGYSLLIYPNTFQFEDRFTMFPGIVDTDELDIMTGCIGYFNGQTDMDFKIDPGTPFITVFPFKREEWKMSIEEKVYDQSKGKFSLLSKVYMEGAYKKFMRSKKSFD